MLLVPVRQQAKGLEVPWATLILAAICLLLQAAHAATEPYAFEFERVYQKVQEAEDAILVRHGLGQQVFGLSRSQRALLAAYREGTADGLDPALKDALDEADRERREVEGKDLGHILGYSPASPFSPKILTSMFAHGSWSHVLGNFAFLWLVGAHLEALWGWRRYLRLYLAGGVCANVFYALWHLGDPTVGIGASGAISATVGAFVVMFARAEVRFFWAGWIPTKGLKRGTFDFYSTFLLPLWVINQFTLSLMEARGFTEGVAYSAHLGGLLFGFGFAFWVKRTAPQEAPRTYYEVEKAPEVVDPAYAAPAALLAEGKAAEAFPLLRELAMQRPFHEGVRRDWLRAALAVGEPGPVAEAAGENVSVLWQEGKRPEIVEVYRQVEASAPAAALADLPLLHVVKSACGVDDALAARAAKALLARWPASPHTPAALWEIAQAHDRAGRADLARKAYEFIASRWPESPMAFEAARRLRQAG